jgi:ABC-type transport system substrate-binding protein
MQEKRFSLFWKAAALAFVLMGVFPHGRLAAGGNSQAQSSAQAAGSVAGKSIVRIGITYDPGTLSPLAARNGGTIAVHRTIYEFLIDRDTFGGEMKGSLMESWEQVDDRSYNITIYKTIVDTAGNPMGASDVKFIYDTAKAMGTLPKLNIIDSISVVDQYTAAFKFKDPLALGDLEGILSEIPVVTEASYKASGDNMATRPVGTTAYRVTEVVPGSKIVLEKTGKYWQTDASKMPLAAKSNVDAVEFHIIRESAQLVIALETGAIDITAHIGNARQVARFQSGGDLADKFTVYNYMNNPVFALPFNCAPGRPFANNLALRQAVAYAIDRGGIVSGAFGGNALALKALGSSKYGDYNTAWDAQPYYEHDVAKAKSLMAQAGYPNGGLRLKLLCPNNEESLNMATIIQGYLSEIGITLEIASFENAMFNTLKADSSAYDMFITTYGSTDYIVNLWKLGLYAANYDGQRTESFVVDSRLQSLLSQCITVAGHTTANMNAFNAYLNDNMYVYGLVVNYGFVISNKRITGILLDSRNNIIPGSCAYDFSK